MNQGPPHLPPQVNIPRPGQGLPLPGMNPGFPVPPMGLSGLPVPQGSPGGLPLGMPGPPGAPNGLPLPAGISNAPAPNRPPQGTMIQTMRTGPQVPIGMPLIPPPVPLLRPPGNLEGSSAGNVSIVQNRNDNEKIPIPSQGMGNNVPIGIPPPNLPGVFSGPSLPITNPMIQGGPPKPGMPGFPPGPGMNLPPGPGMNLPPGPGMNLPPGPGMNLPPGPGMNLPRPGMNLPPGPGMNLPPGPGMNLPGPGMNLRPGPPMMAPMGMNPGLPVPPNFPTAPKLPVQNFPPVPPSAFPPPSDFNRPESNPSISIKRVGLSETGINKANNDGRLSEIISKNPGVSLYSNSAGPGQAFINIVGNPQAVNSAHSALRNMESQDTQWYFLNDSGTFQPYETSVNQIIENGFSNGNEMIEISTNGKAYLVIYGQNNFPHQQLLQGGEIYRTIRRGRDAASQNFNPDIVRWYWADEVGNKWKNYEPEACQLIERHYQTFVNKFRGRNLSAMPNKEAIAKAESVLISGTSGFSYLMDFVNMVQRNEKTRRWRAIKKDGLNCQFRVSQVSAEPTPWINHPDPQLG